MSRRFAEVGVSISPARLQAIAAGARLTSDESTDLSFALAASEVMRERRLTKIKRFQRRGIRWLMVAGLVIVALNMLWCLAYVFIILALHEAPY